MADRFFLKTLGNPDLTGPDGRAIRFKVRKHLALLIYLAVDYRQIHTREALVDLFWGGVDLERGRHSLSVALSVLRAALGAHAIQSTNTQVRLLRGVVRLDLDLLERGAILGGDDFPAIEIERFLLDFEIDDAPAFQHWRDRHYAQLMPAIQTAFLTLADHARRSGDMRKVAGYAERLLALDPLSEEGIRARILALAMQGDRVTALRAYEVWKEQLAAQLGAEPSELLQAIAARLRRPNVERSSPAASPPSYAAHWAEHQFVGRAAEFRGLVDAWESTTQYNTRHILLTGESGIGKSTLAMRFGASVALEGAAVARVQCFELEQRIAFGMIGALVSSLLDKPGAIATAPESLAEIARVVPRVRERFPNLPAPRRTEGETARMHFAEGTFALFDSIMDEQPLLLIVDDYPRSDEASLNVLHALLRRVGTDRVMVVLTGRPAEPGESAQVRRIREGVSYLPMRSIALSPLTEEEGDSMLSARLNGAAKEVAAPIRRAILQAGRGNPMALDLLAQDWAAHGEAALAVSLPAMSSDMPASALEAVGYDRLIERMLPDLSPKTRGALQLAAILGPRLNDLDCFDIVDLTTAQTLAAMTDLVDRRLLRDAGGRLEFTNELIRARLYLKIPSAARVRMHAGVADRLLVAGEVGESVPGLEIAWHCIRARRRDQATPYLMSGAREAILHGAPDEAVRALSSALGHLKGRAKDEAVVLLAESYQEMGDWKGALACIDKHEMKHDSDPHLKETAHILLVQSRSELGEMSIDDQLEVATDLVHRAIQTNTHPVTRVRAALAAALLSARLRAPALQRVIEDSVEALHIDGLDQLHQTRLLLAKAVTNYHRRGNTAGMGQTIAGARILETLGAADSTYVRLQIGLGAFASLAGDYLLGIEICERALNAASRLDNMSLRCVAAINLGLCQYRLGQVEVAQRTVSLALPLLSGGDLYDVANAANLEALVGLGLGNHKSVKTGLERLRKAKRSAETPCLKQVTTLFEADILWLMGKKTMALELIDTIWPLRLGPLAVGFEGKWARWTTLRLRFASRQEEALAILGTFYGDIGRYDLFDQAEILCSLQLVGYELGAIQPECRDMAKVVLSRLPLACSRQLQDLGLRLPD